jgi:hypothetical protein
MVAENIVPMRPGEGPGGALRRSDDRAKLAQSGPRPLRPCRASES